MAEIKAAQVMDLRKKTGVGMMDAKKALVATDGDMDKAVDFLREKGMAKAAKKSGRIAAEGLTDIKVSGNTATIVEVNSETDFVSGGDQFKALIEKVSNLIAQDAPKDVDAALALSSDAGTLNDELIQTTQVTGEKISLRRFQVMEKSDSENFGAYLHMGGRIGALALIEGADEATAKDVAMHVAAVNPEFVSRDDIPQERLEHEREVLTVEAQNEGKPAQIVAKMVEGRLNKFLSEISLADQEFVKDPDTTVAKYVASKGGKLKAFVRYEVGEGIEKKADNFVEEVMGQIKD